MRIMRLHYIDDIATQLVNDDDVLDAVG